MHSGSWWEDWADWISTRAGGRREPPPVGSEEHPPLGPAPGTKLPAGSSLAVYGHLINNGSTAGDALTGVSAVGGVAQLGTVKGGAIELPLHKAVDLAQAGAPAAPSASPTVGATPSAAPSAKEDGPAVLLKGTTREIAPGEYIRLTLQLRNAQAITVNVRGDIGGSFFLAVSSPALCGSAAGTVCTSFTGISNSLILTAPICGPPLFVSGLLSTTAPGCGALLGTATIFATFPNAGVLPIGSTVTIQALVIFATAAVNPEFTCAITVTAI